MTTEARPRNTRLTHFLKHTSLKHGDQELMVNQTVPVGFISDPLPADTKLDPAYWMKIDGRQLDCTEHAELYAVIGDEYCPPMIAQESPLNLVQKIALRFGLKIKRRKIKVLNPDYVPGKFRIPDLRGHFDITNGGGFSFGPDCIGPYRKQE